MTNEEKVFIFMRGFMYRNLKDMEEAKEFYMEFIAYQEGGNESYEQMQIRVLQGLENINNRLDEATIKEKF